MIKYFKKYPLQSILAPLFKMLEATFELLVPFIVKDIIDIYIPNHDKNKIIISFIILILLGIGGLILAFIAQYFSAKVATKITRDIKNDLMSHIETLSYQDLDILKEDNIITKLTQDATLIQNGINLFLRLFLRSPFVIIGAIICSLLIDIKLGLIMGITVPVIFIIALFILLKSIKLFKKSESKLDKMVKRTKEDIDGIRVLKAYNNLDYEINENNKEVLDYTKYNKKISFFNSLLSPLTYVVINIAIIVILYVGSDAIKASLYEKGTVVSIYNYMMQILIEIIKLANLSIVLSKSLSASQRIKEFFQIPNSQHYLEKSDLTNNTTDKMIEFKNVDFKYYRNKENSLSNINIAIKKGEVIGLIGLTGSGKTTLLNLIGRLYDQDSGNIYIDNNNIKNYSKDDIRKKVVITSNQYFFLRDSIRHNLTLGQTIDEEKIIDIINKTLLKEVIDSKGGLDSLVMENGSNFSGGQKQRLSIARSLLLDPDILVLDDITSALDYVTEKNIIKNLKEINKTTIIASQRISSIKNASRIIVIDNGKIVGFDNHENLLKNNELYQSIYRLQMEERK